MATIFITGSADGLGRLAAEALLDEGHQVIVHGRSAARLNAVQALLNRGATGVVGDLADMAQVRTLADDVNALGPLSAVIHNAGVIDGRALLPVNVVAPYLLTTLIESPRRLIYLSSSMHHGGHPKLGGLDWCGQRLSATYSDTKLFVTTLAAAVARLRPDMLAHAVDPGWVPTKMGGEHAPDDLHLGQVTQTWLATSDDARVKASGGYWYHQTRQRPHRAVLDVRFQDELLDALARHTGTSLPTSKPE